MCLYLYQAPVVMNWQSEIKIGNKEKPVNMNLFLPNLMLPSKLLRSFTVTIDKGGNHISFVAPAKVWISDENMIFLTNTKGEIIHNINDLCNNLSNGVHTVNSDRELIYIDKNHNINKVSMDRKETTTFVGTTGSTWKPQCVYWSPLNRDLLVGMYSEITEYTGKGRIIRYNQTGLITQQIPHGDRELELYTKPRYITENLNENIIVSDYSLWSGAVVVTERGGHHRFSYTGHPPESGILPKGICTDTLSNIIVCDTRSKAVQLIDRDGQFLTHLLTESLEMGTPQCLSYDFNNHCLYVAYNKMVCVYKYAPKQEDFTGKCHD